MRARSWGRWVVGAGSFLAIAVAAARPAPGVPPAPPAPAPVVAPETPPAAEPQAPSGPVPHIKFEATELDLGDVVRGKDAVATFTYTNTGEAPLHILSAKPG